MGTSSWKKLPNFDCLWPKAKIRSKLSRKSLSLWINLHQSVHAKTQHSCSATFWRKTRWFIRRVPSRFTGPNLAQITLWRPSVKVNKKNHAWVHFWATFHSWYHKLQSSVCIKLRVGYMILVRWPIRLKFPIPNKFDPRISKKFLKIF